ncbi:Eco57I restriction-modification methylase [compost metagenome]
MMSETDDLSWWDELHMGGWLLSPEALTGLMTLAPPPWPTRRAENLHAVITQHLEAEAPSRKTTSHLVDLVLQDALGYSSGWLKPSSIGANWTQTALDGEMLKPQRLWKGRSGGLLPVFLAEPHLDLGSGRGKRLGAKAVEWLRRQGEAIALLTNGSRWRLLHATPDQSAFVEWDAADFFAAGKPTAKLLGMRHLLGIQALRPSETDGMSPLSTALTASRAGRSELSQQMGERVRQAVELLITSQAAALDAVRESVHPRILYVAACRIIMRLVVLLFAEARGLLPSDNPIYRASYGLSSLQDQLSRMSKASQSAYSAWPRVLGAFKLVYEGSHHRDLGVPAYGGELFEPGEAEAADPLSRALAALESPEGVSDRVVGEILDLLCRMHGRLQVGAQRKRVSMPVDFSDLSGAYIGILYEGLLDYELRRAKHDPILFLNLGKQPAMPLSQLEGLDDKALRALLDGLRKRGEEADPENPEESDDPNAPSQALLAVEEDDARLRAHAWASRALEVGKLLGSKDLADPAKREQAIRALIVRIVLPGEWYLVRWGGTRKGSGSFYTRPELTLPMVRRTLHPLVYVDSPTGDSLETSNTAQPREPEALLALKICDPSMGSGSFLVAALRYLTDALLASLHAHGRIQAHGRQTVVTLASGTASHGALSEEALPLPPEDENFEPALRARLKRHLVERCLYGVDLDPLAVELGKLALWVETMDRELPFSFLDHKLKVGNALVGAWFDGFLKYPLMAWEREGGDKGHRGAHVLGDSWTSALKAKRGQVRAELDQLLTGSLNWLSEDRSSSAIAAHAHALEKLTQLHAFPVHRSDLRAQLYRKEISGSAALGKVKRAFDTWCSIWFWPADQLDCAPTPLDYLDPSPGTLAMIKRLSEMHRFFHWELEFPDVFTSSGAGFDAIVGNPPWETQKPNSQEFFDNHDALYRTYGKQEALRQQQRYFLSDPSLERRWLDANAQLKALNNWVRHTASPFGEAMAASPWARQLVVPEGFSDPEHPFRHQGSGDPNTYKLFLELSHALLKPSGQMGLIVPASLYGDKGAQALRTLFLERCRWRWLFGFENRERLFDIDSRFKFCMVILQKGGRTQRLQAAFMRHDRGDWERAEELAFPYDAALTAKFSPKSRAFLELERPQDVSILKRIYSNAVLLGETGNGSWGIQSGREFHMTDDSALFRPRAEWEVKGYRPVPEGHWIGPRGAIALPFYQGVMIHQYDYSAKAWIRGTGLSALWESMPWAEKRLAPQFLMAYEDAQRKGDRVLAPKVTYRSIARNTDERTLIASLNPGMPCGHKLGVLRTEDPMLTCALPALLNSFVLDWVARIRIGGTQVDAHIVAELPLIYPQHELLPALASHTLRLNAPSPLFAPLWMAMRPYLPENRSLEALYCLTPHERLRVRCMTEALIAWLYGLRLEDLNAMLAPDPSNPRGFWRVDRDAPVELRLTTLTLEAFKDLLAVGPFRFLEQNEGEGWMLPETLEVENEKRLVRSAMGERFAPWQRDRNPEESWKACREHAERLMPHAGSPAKVDSSRTMRGTKQPCLF